MEGRRSNKPGGKTASDKAASALANSPEDDAFQINLIHALKAEGVGKALAAALKPQLDDHFMRLQGEITRLTAANVTLKENLQFIV